jgi:hypothetical protein
LISFYDDEEFINFLYEAIITHRQFFLLLELFTLCIIIYVIGILYIIFVLQEVQVKSTITKTDAAENEKQTTSFGHENPAFVGDNNKGMSSAKNEKNTIVVTSETTSRGFLREFFDLTLTLQLVDVIIKKRPGNLRTLVWLVLACNVIFLASLGESDLTYLYTRLKLNWDGVQFSFHLTYGTVIALVGTLIMVGIFSKFLGVTDSSIGIISTIFTLISKPIYAFATTTFMFYFGTSCDIFVSCKAIAIKSIISKAIQADELGRIFSVLGILESVATFIFPSLYATVYLVTVESFIGAIYFLSEFLFLLTLVLFM